MMPDSKQDDASEGQTGPEGASSSVGEQAEPRPGDIKTDGPKKPRRWPWLIILVLILAAVAVWFLLPRETRQTYLHNFEGFNSNPPVSDEAVQEETTVESGQQPAEQQPVNAEKPAAPEAAIQPEPEQIPSAESRSVPAANLEIDPSTLEGLINVIGELRAGIDDLNASNTELKKSLDAGGLRASIDELKASNAELKNSLDARRVLDLKSRLRWLTNPGMRLSQIKLAWEDIALLPALSDSDRELARKMLDLSGRDMKQLNAWLSTIDGLSEKYPSVAFKDAELIAEDSWWAWLKNLFHLRRAPSASTQRQNDLHDRLLRVHDRLFRQKWPDQKGWSALLAGIREREGKDADIGLPNDFSSIQHDIAKMRAAAVAWLARL